MENKNEELLDNNLNTDKSNEVITNNEVQNNTVTAETSEVQDNVVTAETSEVQDNVVTAETSEVQDNVVTAETSEVQDNVVTAETSEVQDNVVTAETSEVQDNVVTAETSEEVVSSEVIDNKVVTDTNEVIANEVNNTVTAGTNEVVDSSEIIESNVSKKEKVDNTQYNVTLLFSYFAGGLGIHRLINNRKVSGIILLVISIVLLPITLLLLTIGVLNNSMPMTVVGMVSIPLMLIVGVWVISDFFTIILGKFKNGKGEDIKTSGKFFKNWANVLVIVAIVISVITSTITSFFIAGPVNNAFQDYLDGEFNLKPTIEVDEEAEAFKKNMNAISDAIYLADGSDVVFEDYDALIDPVSEHFSDLGYEVDTDERKDIITFSKEKAGNSFVVEIKLEETDDGYLIEECVIGVDREEDDIDYYSYVLTVGDDINDSGDVAYIVSVSSLDPEFFYFGNYKPEEDSVTLLDADSKEKNEYDNEKDEYQIIDTLKEVTNELIDEEADIFDY